MQPVRAQHSRVAIVGGGLSGLYAAFLLDQQGIHDWVLLESRPSLGGRILSVPVTQGARPGPADRFDLGPAWFWPDFQPALDRLIDDLGLERFEQFEAGDMMVERTTQEPPRRTRGHAASPVSMRLAGGMGALVDALSRRLDPARIFTAHTVRGLRSMDTRVVLACDGPDGNALTWRADHVLLAMPPRLASQSIRFEPALPAPLLRQWQATPTWMAPHAKYVAVYDRPFWRERGLSGQARSGCGPMVEIHDACLPAGSAALFGFVGVPARVRQGLDTGVLQAHCLAQLVRLFGEEAASPRAQFIKDWSCDPFTATAADIEGSGHHATAPVAATGEGPWRGCITGIASEWSPQFPGYLAGCVEAASLGVQALAGRRH